MKKKINLEIQQDGNKVVVLYKSGTYSITINCTVKSLKRKMKKTPEQLCLEDISKLQKKFRSLEQITYIEEVRNWSTDNGFNIRQSDVEITAEKDGKTINLTPEQLKGKEWTFGPEDFKKIESGQKSTKEKMLYILKNRTNKEKKIEESETNSEN